MAVPMAKKFFVACSVICLLVLLFAAVVLPVVSPAAITRDAPRELPWTMPDFRAAKSGWEIGEHGRIHAWVEHFFLPDISPAMVSWFYRYLPISTLNVRGRDYPLYHFFHPTEHGTLRVLEPATDGSPGMGLGALIQREEWFGDFDSRGAARIVAYSDAGFVAVPVALGLDIGEVRHQFVAREGGTAYRVDTVIGSELPIIGALLNRYLRTQVFHPAMLKQWQRHQIEEVSTLAFLLPQLYPQRGEGNTGFVWRETNELENR